MIKCIDNGKWTCIGQSGKPKKAFESDVGAIDAAKRINESNNFQYTKLVAYKCSHCFKYHLVTVKKKIRV